MNDCGRASDSDREPSREGWRAALLRAWRRIAGPPPELTAADVVPPGAQPVCLSCVLPYHPIACRCPHCGEIVCAHATIMPFVWIFVWGPRLQRVVRQKRLSRLLWVGLLVSALAFLGASAVSPYTMFTSPLPDYVPLWGVRLFAFLAWLGMGAANLGAALRMFEAAIRKWGTWREESTAEETAPD